MKTSSTDRVSFAKRERELLDEGEEKEFTCTTDLGLWDPPPTEYGWWFSGQDHVIPKDLIKVEVFCI